jgi:DNA-binding CsgD family transcriptional regulator
MNVLNYKLKIIVMIEPFIQNSWGVSKEMKKNFTKKKVENTLKSFNRACGNNYYVVDYFSRKLIMGPPAVSTFTGYSKALIERMSFNFYRQILNGEETGWFVRVHTQALKIFFQFPESQRPNLEFSYDLIATDINGKELILHHKHVPYQLCANGNLWLALCFVTVVPFLQIPDKAIVVNSETGEKYSFDGNEFRLCDVGVLSVHEEKILRWMASDFSTKQICDCLEISKSNYGRKQQTLFQKLDVKTAGGAVHKAHLLGVL